MNDFFSALPKLETERLILRKLMLSDALNVFQFTKNPVITKFLTWDAHKSEKHTIAFLKRVLNKYEAGEPSQWAIVLKETNVVIGISGFINHYKEHKKAEIAYIMSEKYSGKGYMTEALRKVLDAGFSILKLHRIEAKCEKDNFASEKVMQKLGMQFEGCFRDFLFIKGKYRDFKFYSILQKHFSSNK